MGGVCAHTPVPVMLTEREQREPPPPRGKGREREFWELGALAWGGGREAGSGRLSRVWRAALSKEPMLFTTGQKSPGVYLGL